MERPIFILGLQRAGTNQFLNLLRSHPDTTWPDGEFHEVLRPSSRHGKLEAAGVLMRYLPVLLRNGDVLRPAKLRGRQRLSARDVRWIERVLLRATRANAAEVKRFKAGLEKRSYFTRPAESQRMIVKLVNYNVRLARDLLEGFPDARFVGVVREPFGVCESMTSRGTEVDNVLALYNYFGRTLLSLADDNFPIKIFRLEDLVQDFRSVAEDIYRFCDLDPDAITGICLQDKRRVTSNSAKVVGMEKADVYYSFDHAQNHMRQEVNASATSRLSPAIIDRIARECAEVSTGFGYDTRALATP